MTQTQQRFSTQRPIGSISGPDIARVVYTGAPNNYLWMDSIFKSMPYVLLAGRIHELHRATRGTKLVHGHSDCLVRYRNKKFGSPAWIRTTIHGSKGRCPTI